MASVELGGRAIETSQSEKQREIKTNKWTEHHRLARQYENFVGVPWGEEKRCSKK